MNPRKLLYTFTKAPYSNASGQEGLDAVLIGSAFEQELSLLFLHDGVFQLLDGQNTDGSGLKQFSKTFGALYDLGVEHFYVHDQSMRARGLSTDQLMVGITELNSAQVAELLAQQFRVFTF